MDGLAATTFATSALKRIAGEAVRLNGLIAGAILGMI
jgi:hypothetical protein